MSLEPARAATSQPDDDAFAEAFARGEALKEALLEEAGGGWTALDVARHLGSAPSEVDRLCRDGALLAVPHAEENRYPACQFTPDGIIPDLKEALNAFQVMDPWTRLSVLLSGVPMLPGMKVVDALRLGDRDAALHAVRTFGTHGAL